ncbi:glycine oxidase ThiO [Effusibacillus pohliae]|uniref:glycine oxidase ThiO n=1 Tax=Effusibacillus pohliae TaxID=232270 RepID=UPI000366EEF2|nr:glycine oxidase ThiO [Effusibacillus pohliae]
MRTAYDVCIIGGGVIGCAIAYYTAKKGLRPLVIEKHTLGSQATQASAGMLGAQVEMERPDPLYRLGLKSRALYGQLRAELQDLCGVDIELRTCGMLRLALSEAERETLLARCDWQTAGGQRAEWLEDEDLRRDIGDLFGPTFGALFLPDDHQVRSVALLRALAAAASELGAAFLEHTEAIGFLREEDRIVGVETNNGRFAANHVVLAAGAWSGLLSQWAGVDLPVLPVKGQSVLAATRTPLTPYTVFTHGTYIVPKVTGHTYIGATMERTGFDQTPTLQGIVRVLSDAVRILPGLGISGLAGQLVGLRPGTEDGLPFLGEVPGVAGLLVATGHLRNGILLAPITGLVMSELIAGENPSVDLAPFGLSRLQGKRP